MESTSLTALADEQLTLARAAVNGRSAHTVHGGHDRQLRQTLLALAAGQGLDEHESPGEATLQVLVGRVRVATGDDVWEGAAGDHLALPPARHDLVAIEDAAVLLTVSVELRSEVRHNALSAVDVSRVRSRQLRVPGPGGGRGR